jgi:energy-coupling factor transporter ATP-binding protein EcfA2
MISLENFSYRYAGNDQLALQDLSLTIAEGEFVLLTGPSGCGKTTLALALAGFLFSQYDGEFSGKVDVFSRNPSSEPIYDIADLVGLVQQNPENQFCTLMVEDEIAFGLENRKIPREDIERSLVWALDAVGCPHLRDRSLRSLSGG